MVSVVILDQKINLKNVLVSNYCEDAEFLSQSWTYSLIYSQKQILNVFVGCALPTLVSIGYVNVNLPNLPKSMD